MGSKKGQLFLVAIVFLIGLIFVIQQTLFQYSTIEMSKPFQGRDIEIFNNILEAVNETVRETYYCDETKDSMQNKMEELRISLLQEHGMLYSMDMTYVLNCSNWGNSPPDPGPLNVTISVSGQGRDTRGTFEFHNSQ